MWRRKPRLYAHDVAAPSGRSHVSHRPAAHHSSVLRASRTSPRFVYRTLAYYT